MSRQAHAGAVEDVFRWLERVLEYHGQLTDFLGRLQSGAFIHASVGEPAAGVLQVPAAGHAVDRIVSIGSCAASAVSSRKQRLSG